MDSSSPSESSLAYTFLRQSVLRAFSIPSCGRHIILWRQRAISGHNLTANGRTITIAIIKRNLVRSTLEYLSQMFRIIITRINDNIRCFLPIITRTIIEEILLSLDTSGESAPIQSINDILNTGIQNFSGKTF